MPQYRPSDDQREVDRIQAVVRNEALGRRPLFKPAPVPPALSSDLLQQRLAEELEYVRRRLDALGAILASDLALLTRHAVPLQNLDHIDQTLGHIAKVIAADDKPGAADRISLTDLKARLQRKPAFQL